MKLEKYRPPFIKFGVSVLGSAAFFSAVIVIRERKFFFDKNFDEENIS